MQAATVMQTVTLHDGKAQGSEAGKGQRHSRLPYDDWAGTRTWDEAVKLAETGWQDGA